MEPTKNPQNAGCELRASNVAANNSKAFSTALPQPAIVIDRHVVIGKGADSTYLVTVSPSLPNHPPMIFNEYRRARGYAGGLRLVHRWAIHDETGGGK